MNMQPVVVGVGGSARASYAAVRYGADLARALGTGLELVHVVPTYAPMAPMLPLPPEDLRAIGREVIDEFAALARALMPADQVTTEVLSGARGSELPRVAGHAPALVLGKEQHRMLDRLLVGTTVAGVAARAEVSVVVVPTDRSPRQQLGCVLVGLKSVDHTGPAVRRAFEIASRRGGRVLLVHAWELQGQYDDIITARVDLDEYSTRAAETVERAIAPIWEAWPDVPLEIRVVHGQPARVLRDASREGDLLLLAKHPHALPAGHLGQTGRVLLRESACPVEIVPAEDTRPTEVDIELEANGALLK